MTTDPYLVFFSNIFAVMGLRSLYFLLGAGMDQFYSLKYGLSMILVYIGLKMLLEKWAHQYGFNEVHNLLIIIGILALSIFWSVWFPKENLDSPKNRQYTTIYPQCLSACSKCTKFESLK